MRKALTDTFLRALKEPANGRLEYADTSCRGLEFRITQAGNRSWSYRYRAPVTGKLSRATIGPYPTISLADARLRADELRKGVAGGENPSETKRRAKREAPGRTFKALSDRYVAEYARRTKKSAWRDERNLVLHVLPKWEDLDYAAIRRRDVIELIEGIISHGTPVLANRIQSLVSGIFSFAVDADLLDANPCTRLKKRGEEHAGDRVLTDPEIRLFWNMVVEAPASYQTGQGLRLALLTGVRIGEVAGIVPAEFEWLDDAAKAVWSIPGSRTKNGLTHVVPLAPMALEIAREIAPIASGSYAAAMKRIAGRLPDQWPAERTWRDNPPTPHDLRRTFRTRLPQMGVPADIRDRLMNHIPTDVGSKHYDRYQYLNEKRAAMNLWAAALGNIIAAEGK
jgi:integrase